MAASGGLARVAQWLKGDQAEAAERARREPNVNLLASVEYELSQVSRSFREVRLEKAPARQALPKIDPADFEGKLRNPKHRKQAQWWAVLGLNQ